MELQNKLTATETNELERCEIVIKQGLETFVEVGQALMTIRDKRLYRLQYTTFEDYCRERWGMSRPRAYEMIGAAKVVGNLSAMADIPTSERQARPLTKLEPEVQREAWAQVVEENKDRPENITAKKVQEVAKEWEPVSNKVKAVKAEPLFQAKTEKEIIQEAKRLKEERKQAYKEKMQNRIEEKAKEPISDEELQILKELKAGKTVVININRHFSVLKYAKDNGLYQQIDRYSEWGNPFHVGSDGDRDHVCDAYARYYQDKKSLHPKISSLKGKALGCHCHPQRCHGHELKRIADEN